MAANPIVTIQPNFTSAEGFWDVVSDDRMSYRAIGLFAWLYGAAGPCMTLRDMMSEGDSRSEVIAALRELAAAGYITASEVEL